MSNKETKKTEETQEKVVTKYDLKMKRREEQKAKEKREKQFGTILGILIVAALVCFVASFPIRTYTTVNGAYVTVGGDKVSRVEFDYNYNTVSNNYIAQYGYMYYYYMGIDFSGDLSKMMYTEDLTWKDFFDEMTVDNIARNKALEREAKAAGFTYDTTDEYAKYTESLEKYASEQGTTVKQYIKELYGVYATEARVKPFIEQVMYVSAYYDTVVDKLVPSRDEVQQYYEENKDDYDSVDYRVFSVDALLPTEPTELADPVETPAPDAADGNASGEQTAYQPSEAEIAAAMEVAKNDADRLLQTIFTAGTPMVNVRRSGAVYLLRDWLFAAERVAGDTTVIEDTANHRYYVLAFEQRYLDNTRAADVRMIRTTEDMGQAILDEWKSGAATEESFVELYDKYKDPETDSGDNEGGLYEALASSGVPDELREWIFSDERVSGETAVISPAGSQYTYVVYYIAPNQEEWALDIQNTLQTDSVSEYIDKLIDSVEVEDKKGNLHYLEVYAKQQEEQQGQEEQQEGQQ